MPLPTFFIIGAPKAGTTSLHYYLDQHPQIHMSPTKEPHFFIEREDVPGYVARHVTDLADYERLFESSAAVRGEASPSYAEYPRYRGAPERISALIPDAKLIYMVRDPIDRTLSHYMHNVAVDGERRSLREALADLQDPALPYTCASLYAFQLERYLSHFPRKSILVVDQADLLQDRQTTLSEIFAFLSVEETFSSSRFDEKLGETGDRRMYPEYYMQAVKLVARSSLRRLPRGLRRMLRRSVDKALWPAVSTPELDDDLRTQLTTLYAAETARLRSMTGKRFETWSV
jgi:Sulfotransferase family